MAELREERDTETAESVVSDFERGRQQGYAQGFKEGRTAALVVVLNALFTGSLND